MRNDVRVLRTTRGLSQAALAAAMGVSRQTINSIESDRYTPSLALAIERALSRKFESAALRRYAVSRFGVDAAAERLGHLYERVLGRTPSAGERRGPVQSAGVA